MTRDEAIRILEFDLDHTHNDESKEALRMAIKSLEQQTCEDCISREAVLENIKGLKKSPWFNDDIPGVRIVRKEAVEIIEDLCIKNLPSVNPAKKQELCEDAVSREAVLGLFAQNADAVRPYSKTWEEVKALPSVNPQPKWIPVSERLPEEGESVLTQAMFKDDMKMCVSSRIDWNYWTGWGTRNINIIAWMPLPKPYEPQESEDLGDYPDTIHNQFDNMTGSMNL